MKSSKLFLLFIGLIIGFGIGAFAPAVLMPIENLNEPTVAEQDLIVTYIRSGTFTEEERNEIEEKVVHVYADYNECQTGSETVLARIEKIENENYLYDIEIYSTPYGGAGFLHGTPGEGLEYYTPDLFSQIVFTHFHTEKN